MSIQVTNLSVSYGDHVAVDGLNLTIESGQLYGLLGPNGAGKSTTIHCICGLMQPQKGAIQVLNTSVRDNPRTVRQQVGFVPQSLALYEELSVIQNLQIFGGLHGLNADTLSARIEWALNVSQLKGREADGVNGLSGGMKRRLNLVASLLHDPQIIVCDEPTTGVDPQSRNHLFDTVKELHREGKTIVYTTHYMEEVEALCDHVAIMDHGKLIANDTLHNLTGSGSSLEQVFLDLTGRALRDAS